MFQIMKIKIAYGSKPSQFGELYLPDGICKGAVCLMHGGFWAMPYDLSQFDAVARALCASGYCVWNIEYTRVGEPKRHWQDTFNDVIAAVNALESIATQYKSINLEDLTIVGHSAGGQLALWLNAIDLHLKVKKMIGLAPILDLTLGYEQKLGNRVIETLLDSTPEEHPERFKAYSPIHLIQKKGAEVIIHGLQDDYIPVEWSRDYAELMNKECEQTELIELDSSGHMDFIDPESVAFKTMLSVIQEE